MKDCCNEIVHWKKKPRWPPTGQCLIKKVCIGNGGHENKEEEMSLFCRISGNPLFMHSLNYRMDCSMACMQRLVECNVVHRKCMYLIENENEAITPPFVLSLICVDPARLSGGSYTSRSLNRSSTLYKM